MQFTLPYIERQQYADFGIMITRLNPDGTSEELFYCGNAYAGGWVKDFPSLGYSVVVFPGGYATPAGTSNGRYYFRVMGTKDGEAVPSPGDAGHTLGYTDVVTVVEDIEPYLKLEWWDDEDFVMDAGTIVYEGHGQDNGQNPPVQTSFKNVVYLHADIAKPDYIFEEEGETRDGYFYPFKQISEKRYRFKFFACEYLLDVMRLIRMADHIKITYRGQVYYCDTFLMTPEWEEDGDVASVEVEFDTATVAKKVGRGYIRASRGDFNDDFNNDYN